VFAAAKRHRQNGSPPGASLVKYLLDATALARLTDEFIMVKTISQEGQASKRSRAMTELPAQEKDTDGNEADTRSI
jgi:hypothetical protein